jgi:hypothetical protein
MFFWILAASALPGAGSPLTTMSVTATATATDSASDANKFMACARAFLVQLRACLLRGVQAIAFCRRFDGVGGGDDDDTTAA